MRGLMSVYVDELRFYPPSPRWRHGEACHLVADTLEELHAFAGKLQLRRSWFQPHRHIPHYDLTARRRAAAIRAGAIEVKARDYVRRILFDKARGI